MCSSYMFVHDSVIKISQWFFWFYYEYILRKTQKELNAFLIENISLNFVNL